MAQSGQLKRELGVLGAVMMGLGSIVGTGIFVSVGIGAGVAGPAVLLAIVIAAGVATCNGLSSAQLAANHPVSGGTYEYGYRYLTPRLGFIAGWLFLLAKSASAATAALGFSGYLLDALHVDTDTWLVPLALLTVALFTLVVLGGIRRSNAVNIAIVSLTLLALIAFVAVGLTHIVPENLMPFFVEGEAGTLPALLQASALMFVAYTGYGRVATLGEEVRDPQRTIPRAILATLLVTMVLYISVAFVGVGVLGAPGLANAADTTAAPLEAAAATFNIPPLSWLVTIGAMTAMLGVLINLLLGLSRVLLAMGRRGDMPPAVAMLNQAGTTPTMAVIIMGVIVFGLVLIGNVHTTWSFSAFTVLMYYSLTNLSALRLPPQERLYPMAISAAGLVGCLGLAFWVEPQIWLVGLVLIIIGFVWQSMAKRLWSEPRTP